LKKTIGTELPMLPMFTMLPGATKHPRGHDLID
jgi:hypothetical protein